MLAVEWTLYRSKNERLQTKKTRGSVGMFKKVKVVDVASYRVPDPTPNDKSLGPPQTTRNTPQTYRGLCSLPTETQTQTCCTSVA